MRGRGRKKSENGKSERSERKRKQRKKWREKVGRVTEVKESDKERN